MDWKQIGLWSALALVVVGSILGLLYLTGVLFNGKPSGTDSGVVTVSSRVCTNISDYVESSTSAPQNVDSLSQFGLVVGGTSAGSIVAVYNKDASLVTQPDYLFFGRNTDGNYVEYSDAVLTWDLGATGVSGSPKFASDPRYVAFHVNTGTKSQFQIALVQPVYSVALQRIDLNDERILDVQWIGTRLEFLLHVESVLTGEQEIRHYTQSVIHHWIAADEPVASSVDGLLFSSSSEDQIMVYDSGTGIAEQYDVDATTTWTKNEAAGALDFGTALDELDVTVDATWVAGRSSSGIRVSTRSAIGEAWSVPIPLTLSDSSLFEFESETPGPMRFYLNERLYVLDGSTLRLFGKQGVQASEVTLTNAASATEFHVDQLAVEDVVGLLFPTEAATPPGSFRATCT